MLSDADFTSSRILFCRVSAFFAITIHCRMAFLADLLRPRKKILASLLFLNSAAKSLGILSVSAVSKAVHDPFFFGLFNGF